MTRMATRRRVIGGMAATAAALPAWRGSAQGKPLRIGVLADLSGPYADSGGPGSVTAARLAAQDFGPLAGRTVEIVAGDTQNKPDIAANIARGWFDSDGVSAITDLPVTPIALAVQEVARQKNRSVMITGAAASDITNRTCNPISTHWADDSHALAVGTVDALVRGGADTWFFLIPDYGFGQAVLRDASQALAARGAKVVGMVKHPLGISDYSSALLQAQLSGAKVVATAAASGDLVNTIKQASEFHLTAAGTQTLAGFLVYTSDVNAIGLETAQGLTISLGFYWDQSEASRGFAKRFFAERKAMPTQDHAAVYAAVTQYLRAAAATDADDAVAINRAMRATPFDYFGHPARVREDGRLMYDLTVYRVKTPGESRYAWDLLQPVGKVDADVAFLPVNQAVCGSKP